MDNLKFGIQEYFSKGPFEVLRSNFTETENINELGAVTGIIGTVFILIILSLIFGFIAVNKLCPDNSPRGKNTRLGLYLLLIFSGGSVGWLYIIMWMIHIKLC